MEKQERIYTIVKQKLVSQYQQCEEDIETNMNSFEKAAEERCDNIVECLKEMSSITNANQIWEQLMNNASSEEDGDQQKK